MCYSKENICKQRLHHFNGSVVNTLYKLPWPKHRNFGTQTEKTEEKSTATPNTPKISFFRSKNLFAKKQKKRVKYLKKGPLCRENDQKCMALIFFWVMIIT